MTDTQAHEERDEGERAGIDIDRHAYLADASLLDEHDREVLVRRLDADDAAQAKEFFRYRGRYTRGER